ACEGQADQHVIQKTSIDFLWRVSLRIKLSRRNSRRVRVECGFEFSRRPNLVRRRTELPNQIVQSLDVIAENCFSCDLQCITRALGRNQRIAISIATNPRTETQHSWQ